MKIKWSWIHVSAPQDCWAASSTRLTGCWTLSTILFISILFYLSLSPSISLSLLHDIITKVRERQHFDSPVHLTSSRTSGKTIKCWKSLSEKWKLNSRLNPSSRWNGELYSQSKSPLYSDCKGYWALPYSRVSSPSTSRSASLSRHSLDVVLTRTAPDTRTSEQMLAASSCVTKLLAERGAFSVVGSESQNVMFAIPPPSVSLCVTRLQVRASFSGKGNRCWPSIHPAPL